MQETNANKGKPQSGKAKMKVGVWLSPAESPVSITMRPNGSMNVPNRGSRLKDVKTAKAEEKKTKTWSRHLVYFGIQKDDENREIK